MIQASLSGRCGEEVTDSITVIFISSHLRNGDEMRRPLFTVCLCLVTIIAIGKILTGADTGGNSGLPPDGSPVRITGRIDTRTSETIILKSISIIQNDQKYSYSGKLQCELTNAQEVRNLRLGQQIALEGVFSRFDAATNPGEFDVRAYYEGKGIGGRVRKAQILAVGEDYNFLREKLYGFRLILHNRLARVFPEKEASIMQTLLLGEKEELDAEVKALYQRNGIAHILSISGLHITLLGMGCYRLLKRLGVPVRMAAVGGAVALLLYGGMVGMSVSASRAIGMYLLQMLGIFVGRTYDMLTGLGVLAVVLVLREPERLGDVSFFMSFGAVLGICVLTPMLAGDGREADSAYERNKHREGWRKVVYEGVRRIVSVVKSGFAASAGVILFTLPIQLWFFYEIPIYSVLLNLLVLPFMSVVMAGGILSLIPGLGMAGTVDCLILWWYEWICERFGELPEAIWTVGKPAVWQIIIYYAGILLLIFGRKYVEEWKQRGVMTHRSRVLRRIVAVMILALSVGVLTGNFDRGSRVTFLDVGQGDGIVVETGQGAYLFDCGSTSRKKIGEYVLKPYLKSRGIRSLRGVFVSHPDEDHRNGVQELLENGGEWGITVEQLFLPAITEGQRGEAFDKLLAAAEQAGVPVSYIKCGDEIRDSRFRLLCLHPEENTTLADANAYSECFYVEIYAKKVKWEATVGREANEASRGFAVGGSGENGSLAGGSGRKDFRVDAGKISILLTGDVEGEGERQLTQKLQELRASREAQRLQEPQELQELQEAQRSQELQRLQESQGSQGSQKSQEAQEPQEAQKSQKSQELQELQEPQEQRGQGDFMVDILKVAHHGSGYSTSSEFLAAASPSVAIISCGRNNSYGHPHAETLQRLEEAGVPRYLTTDYGALTITVDSRGKRLRGYLDRK